LRWSGLSAPESTQTAFHSPLANFLRELTAADSARKFAEGKRRTRNGIRSKHANTAMPVAINFRSARGRVMR
jgi:hypothetical protein